MTAASRNGTDTLSVSILFKYTVRMSFSCFSVAAALVFCLMTQRAILAIMDALPSDAGIAVALACAFVLKRFQLREGGEHTGGIAFNGQVYEITIIIMSAYLAYLVAEVRSSALS